MTADNNIEQIELLVDEMLTGYPSLFRVNVKVKPINNIKVYLDGDNGISIELCVKFNRQLYRIIEERNFFPAGDFSLEVSSPGVNEPLKLHRQYVKNIGRNIEMIFNDDSKKEGKLIQVTNNDIVLEQTSGKGKKITTQQLIIPISNVKAVTVQIKF